MAKKFIPYVPDTVQGQALLDNIVRTKRVLRYRDNDKVYERIVRGMPLYEMEKLEQIGDESDNLVIRGECLSACAYLKDQGITVDLVYIDPPFASGADYAKKVYIRRNPSLAEKIAKAEEQMEIEELKAFEEKMYGDIWNKEDYLSWMYENLMAIKSVMSDNASIYLHLDWHISHYVKILMDEVFGEENFKNEIVWFYSNKMTKNSKNFQKSYDSIFFYAKNDENIFHEIKIERDTPVKQSVRVWKDQKNMRARDDNGNIIYEMSYDVTAKDVWEIPFIASTSSERMDYSTQKPEALLERIIKASSDEGMVVADFFGGSGVTAKVASDLGRKFIHVDVGINSIQTVRDRLVAQNASFSILDVRDGVSLFRNPIQTMEKMKSLITGLRNEDALPSFWEGSISDTKLGMIPVYIPNLLDHSTKVLDTPMMNRIINEAIPDLPDGTKKVIVYYVDISDEEEVSAFIRDYGPGEIMIELRDLKALLDEVVINDEIEYALEENTLRIVSFASDRLHQKIDEYNQKRTLTGKGGRISISPEGLELIEFLSLDCSAFEGQWHSDTELKIDKNGYVSRNGVKSKDFWDGTIPFATTPKRLKVRNIAGDETIVTLA